MGFRFDNGGFTRLLWLSLQDGCLGIELDWDTRLLRPPTHPPELRHGAWERAIQRYQELQTSAGEPVPNLRASPHGIPPFLVTKSWGDRALQTRSPFSGAHDPHERRQWEASAPTSPWTPPRLRLCFPHQQRVLQALEPHHRLELLPGATRRKKVVWSTTRVIAAARTVREHELIRKLDQTRGLCCRLPSIPIEERRQQAESLPRIRHQSSISNHDGVDHYKTKL